MSEAADAAPRAAFYGDDFTGSVDAPLQFARAGWSGRLFVGLPDDDALRVDQELLARRRPRALDLDRFGIGEFAHQAHKRALLEG